MSFSKIIGRLAFVLKRSKTSVEEISEKEAGPVSRPHSLEREIEEYDETSDSSDSNFSKDWGLRGIEDEVNKESYTGEAIADAKDLKVTVHQKLKEGAISEKKMVILPEARKISVANGND